MKNSHSELEAKEKIYNLLKYCHRRKHIPDLHSFVANIKGGRVWVDCGGSEISISQIDFSTDGGPEKHSTWHFESMLKAVDRLAALNMDLDSVSM